MNMKNILKEVMDDALSVFVGGVEMLLRVSTMTIALVLLGVLYVAIAITGYWAITEIMSWWAAFIGT